MSSKPQRLRLDQLLSRFGYCSRSEARAWLRRGRVLRGEEVLDDPSERVLATEVLVDGQPVEFPEGLLAAFHKPAGYTCSHDPKDRPTIFEILPPRWLARNPVVSSVGRLDKDATGLLLLTDQGDLIHEWTSPRHHVPKLYEVTVEADLPGGLEALFASGTLLLEGEAKPCLPARLEVLGPRSARVELTEGRYHQVKRMFASQGCPVSRLHRTRIGALELGDLPEGQWREIGREALGVRD
ncbi:MAG: Ribosomal small subunit pseudouridine synthase [Verrucomicrobiota bacterium]|jgi:16S rRNA pseudouridine516 synthase